MNDTTDDVFRLLTGREGEWTVLTLVGEFDTHAALSFDRVVNDLTTSGDPKLLIDLSGVTFVDSSGLRSLVRARTKVGGKDTLVLRGPRTATVRLLEITGLLDEFTIA
jgi:anti-sigma B factor antagonist